MTAQPTSDQAAATRGDDAGIWVTLRQSPLAVKAMLAGVFVNKLGGFIQVFLVLFLIHRGFAAVQAGAALSAYGAGAVLGVLVGGSLSDRLGPRRATLTSMVGTAVLVLGVLYVSSYPALLTVVALLGAIGVVYRPAAAALLSELTPQHRQVMIMALYRLALNVGTTAAPLVGAALIAISYHLLFWGEALAALGYAAIAAIAVPRRGASAIREAAEARETAARETAEARETAARGAAVQAAGPAVPDTAADTAAAGEQPGPAAPTSDTAADGQDATAGRRARGGFLTLLGDGRYLLFLFALFINAIVYIQYLSTLPLAMHSAGLITAWYAAVVALNGAIVIGCELLMTKLTQRWAPRLVVMTGFALLGIGMAAYALPWGVGIFVAGTLIWTLAEIVAGPTVFAYPAMAAPKGLRGRYLGASQAVFSLGFAIGPVVGVTIWHAAGRGVWLWCAAACLLGLGSAQWGMRTIRPEPDSAP